MAKCPVCKEEIDSLNYSEDLQETGELHFNKEHNGFYYAALAQDRTDIVCYCPECNSIVARTEKEAHDILKNN